MAAAAVLFCLPAHFKPAAAVGRKNQEISMDFLIVPVVSQDLNNVSTPLEMVTRGKSMRL